jgi:hypothetical protein
MDFKITSALGGTVFAFATYFFTIIVSLLVAGMIHLLYRIIHKANGNHTGKK